MLKKFGRFLGLTSEKRGQAPSVPAKVPMDIGVDYAAAVQDVGRQADQLFARLQADQLRPDDLVEGSAVKVSDFSAIVEHLHGAPDDFDAQFGSFKLSYVPFGSFAETDVVLDIGADWGYSVLAMRRCGCRSKIISMDVSPFHRAALDRLCEIENGNFDWVNVAIGESDTPLTLYTPVVDDQPITGLTSAGKTLNAHVVPYVKSFAEQYMKDALSCAKPMYDFGVFRFTVDGGSIESILRAKDIALSRIAAVKIDIEGHEGQAIAGARILFGQHKPLLMVEGANRNPQVRAEMSAFGYFHCELQNGVLQVQLGTSAAVDGYWIHPDRVEQYRAFGFWHGEVPDRAAIAGQSG